MGTENRQNGVGVIRVINHVTGEWGEPVQFYVKRLYYDDELSETRSVTHELRNNDIEITMSFQDFLDMLKE
jgi:hypothetical protein